MFNQRKYEELDTRVSVPSRKLCNSPRLFLYVLYDDKSDLENVNKFYNHYEPTKPFSYLIAP